MNDFLLDRFNLPMAAGVYFEHIDTFSAPVGSDVRITEDGEDRLTEDDVLRVTE